MLNERVSPEKAALIVIDMQNDFVSPNGKMSDFGFDIQSVRDSIQPNMALLRAARSGGYPVLHTCVINDIDQNPPSWFSFWGEPAVTLPGSWGAAHIEELQPQPGEIVITKYTYGAFTGTNLDAILRRKGIETLIMTGADLNICVADSLHQAFALGYHVVAVADCLSCFSKIDKSHAEQLKQMGLYIIENHYGTVAESAKLIDIMNQGD